MKQVYIHKLTSFSHRGRQKLQNATCYDPYILISKQVYILLCIDIKIKQKDPFGLVAMASTYYRWDFSFNPGQIFMNLLNLMLIYLKNITINTFNHTYKYTHYKL